MTESELQRIIMKEVTPTGARLFRNNTGMGLMVQHRDPTSKQFIIEECVKLAERRGGSIYRLHFGLCEGSSDLIGWTPHGQFLAAEVKHGKGKLTPEQANFLDQVNRAGGIGIEARSVEDVLSRLSAKI